MSRFKAALIIVSLFATPVFAATPKAPVQPTQGEFARKLVENLGWSEGLPENPEDRDYLTILSGKRRLEFEAENTFDKKSDQVAVRNFPLFGKFTGTGWIQAPTTQSAVHFKVLIPIEGRYSFKVTSKGDGQLWSIAGKAFKLSTGNELKEVTLGQVNLPAGWLEFNAVIPPAGAIDRFSFSASGLKPVEPVTGWNFQAPLTATDIHETFAALLDLEQQLPDDNGFQKVQIKATSANELPAAAIVTDAKYFGKPLSGKWIRLPHQSATVSIPFESEGAAVYTLRVRAMGETVDAGFNGIATQVKGKPYLDWVDVGAFRLGKGPQTIDVTLPSTGGIDAVEIGRKSLSAEDYASLTKLSLPAKGGIKPENLEAVIKAAQERFKERK